MPKTHTSSGCQVGAPSFDDLIAHGWIQVVRDRDRHPCRIRYAPSNFSILTAIRVAAEESVRDLAPGFEKTSANFYVGKLFSIPVTQSLHQQPAHLFQFLMAFKFRNSCR